MASKDEKEYGARWGTLSEIRFLNIMSPDLLANPMPGTTRLTLLMNYRKGIDKRDKWGNIDRVKVRDACDEMIRLET